MKNATYLALTTTNYRQNGYHVVSSGSDKAAVRKQAEEKIGNADIYAQTEQRNLIVISKSEARRKGYVK